MSSATTNQTGIPPEGTEKIFAIASSVRALSRRPLDLSGDDVLAIAVEPVLEVLGWSTRDPRQVRRNSGRLQLLAAGKSAVQIQGLTFQSDIPESLKRADMGDAEWAIVTNGSKWAIFNRRTPGTAFRRFSLEKGGAGNEAIEVLAMLRQDGFRRDSLAEAWLAEAMDAQVAGALIRHLDGSQELVAAIARSLSEAGFSVGEGDIRAALERIQISVETDNGTTEQVSPAAASTAEATAPTAARKPAAAKTRKASAKARPAAAAKTGKAAEKTAAPAKAAKSAKPAAAAQNPRATAAETAATAPDWVDDATHKMTRKMTTAFITHRPEEKEATLLPGSLLTVEIGRSLEQRFIEMRNKAKADGAIVETGGMFKVVKPIPFPTPVQAATFAAGTQVKDIGVWMTRSNKSLREEIQAAPAQAADRPAAA